MFTMYFQLNHFQLNILHDLIGTIKFFSQCGSEVDISIRARLRKFLLNSDSNDKFLFKKSVEFFY